MKKKKTGTGVVPKRIKVTLRNTWKEGSILPFLGP